MRPQKHVSRAPPRRRNMPAWALCITISDDRGDESFADDLNMGRGIVSGRVALLLRSTEIPPHRPNDLYLQSSQDPGWSPSTARLPTLRKKIHGKGAGARRRGSAGVPARGSPGARESRSEGVPERGSPGARESRREAVPARGSPGSVGVPGVWESRECTGSPGSAQ